jgi:hypothetical protein
MEAQIHGHIVARNLLCCACQFQEVSSITCAQVAVYLCFQSGDL